MGLRVIRLRKTSILLLTNLELTKILLNVILADIFNIVYQT